MHGINVNEFWTKRVEIASIYEKVEIKYEKHFQIQCENYM